MRITILTHVAALLCLLFLSSGGVAAAKKAKSAAVPRPPRRSGLLIPRQTRYDRFLEKAFDQADTNEDGRMTLAETYEWVLRLYIQINRQAPIDPPTMTQVKILVKATDDNHDNYISQEEFRDLAEICARRAAVRVAANKFITLIVAPLLAEGLLGWFKRQAWLYETLVVPYAPERFIPVITNPVIGRTVLMVILVSTLGRTVMEFVNDLLGGNRIEAEEEQKAAASKKKGRR